MTAVLSESRDGIATITLNRPERLNAITADLAAGLHAELTAALADPAAHSIILTGQGDRAFCAGDDLLEHPPVSAADLRRQLDLLQDITRLIVFGEKPVIAAVNGWAVGGGLEWVINCDFSIWSESARAFFPEVSIGLGVTGAVTALLPRTVGVQRAKALFMLGEKQTARTMLELGIAHAVVPADRVVPEARALAHRLGALPQAALRGLKRTLGVVSRDEIERALAAEQESISGLLADPTIGERLVAHLKGSK